MGILEVAKEMSINQGKETGAEKQKSIFVTNLLSINKFFDKEVASLADVSLKFVQQVKSGLNK